MGPHSSNHRRSHQREERRGAKMAVTVVSLVRHAIQDCPTSDIYHLYY